MLRFTRVLFLPVLVCFSSATLSATYNYQGPPLDGLTTGDYARVSPPRSITGYIRTSEPLPANATELDIRPYLVEWYFTDGFVTLNSIDGLVDAPWSGSPDFPKVSTDGAGNIERARILAWESPFFDAVDEVSDSLQVQGFPPPWNENLATGDVAGKIICGSVENGACATVSGNTDAGFSQIDALGTWSLATREASPLSSPVGPGAEAICGEENTPSPYDAGVDSNLAECSALGGALAGTAHVASGEVKVYAADEDGGPDLNYATAAFVDLITVTEGWDENNEVSGTFTLSIDGLMDDSNIDNEGTAIFDVYLWNTNEPTPDCIYDSDDCGFYGGGNGHDYATAVFGLYSGSVEALTAAAFEGSGVITSTDPADLGASLSIDWTVTRDNPSYYIGVVGYASVASSATGKVDFAQTATARLAGPAGFDYVSRNGFTDATLLIQDLVDAVNALNLELGISNALDSKLTSAIASLEDINDANDVAVVNTLYAFISNVDAQAGKMIPEQDAQALIASAESIIQFLME